jgi:hypothetical protein
MGCSIHFYMSDQTLIPSEMIEKKIFIIRGKKVMLDKDLADLYQVTTKILNQAVKRNLDRFPEDFMFRLTATEKFEVVTNCDHLAILKFSPQLPYAFTEQGVSMLSSVLKSKQAIRVNIQIMRTFTRLREMLMNYRDLREKIDTMEKKYDNQFKNVFEAIKLLIQNDQQINQRFAHEESQQKNKKYGFRPKNSSSSQHQ